ncbi:MAG: hypothetical protein ACO375_00180 [Candidatus Nanopelagicaceae bacterium]
MSGFLKRGKFTVTLALLIALLPFQGSFAETSSEWQPTQIQETAIPLNWSRASTSDDVTLDQYGRRPPINPDQLTFFLACERDDQLDCIESFGLVESDGTFREASFTRATTEMMTLQGVGPVAWHSTFWEVPGLTYNGAPVEVRFDGKMGSDKAAPGSAGMQMGLELVPKSERARASKDDLYGCLPGPRPDDWCAEPVVIPENLTMRLVFKTSWISPAIVRARMREANLELQELGKGALRWTLTGKAMLGQSFTLNEDDPQEKDRPAWVSTSFDLFVWDPQIYQELDSACYVNGPIFYSFNGMTGGQPNWNPQTGTLDVNVGSLHYWPDGKTIWRGYYQTSLLEETARCLWGIDPSLTSSIRLEIYDEEGQSKVATTSVNYRDGKVNIFGYDFTYSTTKLSVKVLVKKGTRCVTRGAQIRNLTCKAAVGKSKKAKSKKLVWSASK